MNFLITNQDSRKRVCDFIMHIRDDVKWSVVIEELKPRRSLSANNHYFGFVVTPLARHCGYTVDEMHDELLGSYFGWEEREFRGHKRIVPKRRTTFPDTLTPEDFKNLTLHGEVIAAELGVSLAPGLQEAR